MHLLCRRRLSTPGFWWRLWRIPEFPSWSVAPPCASSVWTSRWLDEDLLSSSAPRTAGCRTREMSHWWLSLWLPWTAGHPQPAVDPGWPLLLERNVMHWWVSWGRSTKARPSSTVLVDQQVPSKLRHCGTKSARRVPTCSPSAAVGWGSWLAPVSFLRWVGTGQSWLPCRHRHERTEW